MVFPHLPQRVAEIREKISAASARSGLNQHVAIIAVTKTHGPESALEAWECGIRDCGENRVQEAVPKIEQVNVPVVWHLIGHLQRNKVKSLGHFAVFHALDSSRLADAISQYAVSQGRVIDALLQVNVSGEESKGGFSIDQVRPEADRLMSLPGLRIIGAMTMAPLNASERELRETFSGARRVREILVEAGHPATELSMGMSNDYEIAVEEGATFVRLGTALFGEREG
jgi:pyridoxal phosphate enzyme (YggS family)